MNVYLILIDGSALINHLLTPAYKDWYCSHAPRHPGSMRIDIVGVTKVQTPYTKLLGYIYPKKNWSLFGFGQHLATTVTMLVFSLDW